MQTTTHEIKRDFQEDGTLDEEVTLRMKTVLFTF